jgi:hypothetical protein
MTYGYSLLTLLLFAAGSLLLALPVQAQTAPDFTIPVTVSDGTNSKVLEIGMDAAATDGFDSGIDGPAPPQPPSSAFDTRIEGPGEGLFTDVRASTTEPLSYVITYRPEQVDGAPVGPITVSWDPADFPGTVQGTIAETGLNMNDSGNLDTSTDGALDGSLTIELDVVTPPAAPSNLDASASSTSQIDLTWQDEATDEAGYEVEQSTSGSSGPFSSLADLSANATSYTHTGLTPNSEYCYRVRSTNIAGASNWTSVACATTPSGTLAVTPSETSFSLQEGASNQTSVTVTASPSTSGPVSLSADAAWLSVPATAQPGASFAVTADAAALSDGTYTGTVTATAPDFAAATLTVELTVLPNLVTDFVGQLTVTDDNGTAKTLTFGTSPEATAGVDAFYDQKAPPAPPSGAFDARLTGPTDDLYADFRATNTGEVSWTAQFAPADGGAPITLTWDNTALPSDGRFVLVGSGVEVDMRSQDTYVVNDLTINELSLVYSLTSLVDLSANSGWNLVGLPLDVLDPYYQSVFAGLAPQQAPFWFDGTYVQESSLTTGKGYWLDAQNGGTQTVEGYDVGTVTLSLDAGWNLIAGPSCGVPLASADVANGALDPSTLYGFDQVYTAATALEPGAGYWIEASAATDVTFTCTDAKRTDLVASTDASDGHAHLTVRSASGATQTLRIGASTPGRSYALPPLPPSGAFDVRFDNDSRLLSETEGRIRLQGTQRPLTVALAQLRTDDRSETTAYLVEALAEGQPVAEFRLVEPGDNFEVHDAAVTELRVTVESGPEYPGTFALRGNFPNPFGESTRLVFDLPDNALVTMEVYDMLGRRLFVQEEQVAAGADRSLQMSGAPFPPGNYFYRLRADMNGSTSVKTGRFSVVR